MEQSDWSMSDSPHSEGNHESDNILPVFRDGDLMEQSDWSMTDPPHSEGRSNGAI